MEPDCSLFTDEEGLESFVPNLDGTWNRPRPYAWATGQLSTEADTPLERIFIARVQESLRCKKTDEDGRSSITSSPAHSSQSCSSSLLFHNLPTSFSAHSPWQEDRVKFDVLRMKHAERDSDGVRKPCNSTCKQCKGSGARGHFKNSYETISSESASGSYPNAACSEQCPSTERSPPLPWRCILCDKSFSEHKLLNMHYRNVHEEIYSSRTATSPKDRNFAPDKILYSTEFRAGHRDAIHIACNAHTLYMFKNAAEKALGVAFGVLCSPRTGHIPPVIELRGPVGKLRAFAKWIPGFSILGNGLSPPPAVANISDDYVFSESVYATKVWTQPQLRMVMLQKKEALAQELGYSIHEIDCTYLAQSVADCVILYCMLKDNLPVATKNNMELLSQTPAGPSGTLAHQQLCENESKYFMVQQPLMFPPSTAVRTSGRKKRDVEVAVDNENKLLLKQCTVEEIVYDGSQLREYWLHPSEGAPYERIVAGTLAESAFRQSRVRFICGRSGM